MTISYSRLPAFIQSLRDGIREDRLWIGFDSRIQQITANDLHFFPTKERALDFQDFNQQQQKQISLLPVEATLYLIESEARKSLKEGEQAPFIQLDPLGISDLNKDFLLQRKKAELEELLDSFDWKEIFYDPLEANTETESLEGKIAFNRLEFLVEQLSAFAQTGGDAKMAASDLMERYWVGQPMEVQIKDVLAGVFVKKSQSFFKHKNNVMNTENLEYLQKQLLYAGFGEGLNTQLERRIKDGPDDFQLQASHEFGKDKMEAVLHFAKSKQEGSDMYFFNKYDASLSNAVGAFAQTFFINNKGQSITFREACNLLNGRSVYKELSPKEGEKYKAWVKLDFSNRDENGNAKLNIFNDKYGFDLKEALSRVPIKELGDPEQMKVLFDSLQKGNLVTATLVKSDKQVTVQLAADPKFKTVKMFDMEGTKLYVPAPKQEVGYGQAPVDAKREAEGSTLEVGQSLVQEKGQEHGAKLEVKEGTNVVMNKKHDLLPKKVKGNSLLPKKHTRKAKGKGIA